MQCLTPRCLAWGVANHRRRNACRPTNAPVASSNRGQFHRVNRSKPIFKTKSTVDDRERPRTNKFRNAPLVTVVVSPDQYGPSRVHLRSGALWALSPDGLCTRAMGCRAPVRSVERLHVGGPTRAPKPAQSSPMRQRGRFQEFPSRIPPDKSGTIGNLPSPIYVVSCPGPRRMAPKAGSAAPDSARGTCIP
jgi:hypothetical protein